MLAETLVTHWLAVHLPGLQAHSGTNQTSQGTSSWKVLHRRRCCWWLLRWPGCPPAALWVVCPAAVMLCPSPLLGSSYWSPDTGNSQTTPAAHNNPSGCFLPSDNTSCTQQSTCVFLAIRQHQLHTTIHLGVSCHQTTPAAHNNPSVCFLPSDNTSCTQQTLWVFLAIRQHQLHTTIPLGVSCHQTTPAAHNNPSGCFLPIYRDKETCDNTSTQSFWVFLASLWGHGWRNSATKLAVHNHSGCFDNIHFKPHQSVHGPQIL